MSSSVLHDQIPHSILFPNQPLFCLPPSVFNCICFVYILTTRQDKLSAKATKCVFLSYSRLHRGYRCYSTNTNRYFIFVDVTFFDGFSFFSSEELPHVSDVLHVPLVLPPLNFLSPLTDAVARPLQVYTHFPRPQTGSLADSYSMSPSSPALVPQPPNDLPIAIRKSTRSTCNPHLIYNFLSYHRLSLPNFTFIFTLSSVSIPTSTSKVLSHPRWKQSMVEEMDALSSNGTWELFTLSPDKSHVGCRWVYTVKVGPNGQVDRLKTRLVAKGYTQQYGLVYYDIFSPVAKIASVRLLFSVATMRSWPLLQLNIKNFFLHGDLAEEVYMEQPPCFVAQEEPGLVYKLRRSLYGLKQSSRAWFSQFTQWFKGLA